MTCPVCHSAVTRRSKRRSVLDYLFSATGILPWRCEDCEARFHARPMPFRQLRYAHCPTCGNFELRPISAGRVTGMLSPAGRLLGVPALRCEPCRKNFFSVRPVMGERSEVATGADLTSR